MTPNCMLYIVPVDAISASIRLNWTLNEFYADGGSTAFSDRMAASLGIKSYDIKVVSVYQGSVVILWNIQDQSGEIAKKYGTLKQVSLQLSNLVKTNQL